MAILVERETSVPAFNVRSYTNNDPSQGRDPSLDFVKGILVVAMVVYHLMNYFSTAGPQAFGYVRFVTGSFVFMSGYIVATFYKDRFLENWAEVTVRLLTRGIKLSVLFTVLNILIAWTGIGNPAKAMNVHTYLNNISAIYGIGSPRMAAFQILLPISYLLMISPLLLFLVRMKTLMLAAVLAIHVVYPLTGIDSVNLGLGIVGLAGLTIGISLSHRALFSVKGKSILLFFILLTISQMPLLDRHLLTYSIGILVLLKLFYDFAKTANPGNAIYRGLVLLGQYSLVCYIIQIVFLQGLNRVLARQRWGLGIETLSICTGTVIFLLLSCLLIKYLRSRFKLINKLYRLIFS